MSVHYIIEELKSNNSRLFKESVLQRELNNHDLKRAFFLALDPFTQFYIKKIPDYTEVCHGESAMTLGEAMDYLSLLSSRAHTGHAGIAHLKWILENLYTDDALVIEAIIAGDLECGVNVSTVNKVWDGLIPEIPYMRCSLLKDMKVSPEQWAEGLLSQKKADGMFVNVDVLEDGIQIYSRAGSQFNLSHFPALVAELIKRVPVGHQVHGEFLIEEDGEILDRQTGNGVFSSLLKGGTLGIGQNPILEVWDIIPKAAAVPGGKYQKAYQDRLAFLTSIFEESAIVSIIETKIVYSMSEALAHYSDMIDQGFEGTVLKLATAIWEDTTSRSQWKFKVEFDCDLKMVKLNPGNGKNKATFGSIQCETEDGELVVNIPGFKDDKRKWIFDNWASIVGGIATVKANGILKPKKKGSKFSLFLPRFTEIRDDKSVADSLQRVFDQFDSVVKI